MQSELVPLSEFCTVKKGLSYKGEFIHQDGPALLGIGTIKEGGGFRPDKVRTYGGPFKKSQILNPGDCYVALTSQDGLLIGSVAKVPADFQGFGIATHHVAKIEWKIADLEIRDFLFWVMHTHDFIQHCIYQSVGTTVYATSPRDVEKFEVPISINENQKKMVRMLNSVHELGNDELIKSTRDAFLPILMSGELSVS